MKLNEVKIGSRWALPDGTVLYVWCVTNLARSDMMMHPPLVVLREEEGLNYYSIFLDLFPFDLNEVTHG